MTSDMAVLRSIPPLAVKISGTGPADFGGFFVEDLPCTGSGDLGLTHLPHLGHAVTIPKGMGGSAGHGSARILSGQAPPRLVKPLRAHFSSRDTHRPTFQLGLLGVGWGGCAAASRKTCSREGTSGLGVAVTFAQLVSITGRPTGDVSAAEETKTDCRPEEESRDS